MATIEQMYRNYIEGRVKDFAPLETDAPFTKLLKILFRCPLYNFGFHTFLWHYLCLQPEYRMTDENTSHVLRRALDLYCFAMFFGVLSLYLLTHAFITFHPVMLSPLGWLVFVPVLLLSGYRLLEITADIVQLYELGNYRRALLAPSPLRIILYLCEVVIAFASVYLLLYWLGDSFQRLQDGQISDFAANPINPVYFSVVTITTVGYGDFSPQTQIAKLIVIGEVLLGVVGLVIVLQSVLSLSMTSKTRKTDQHDEKDCE